MKLELLRHLLRATKGICKSFSGCNYFPFVAGESDSDMWSEDHVTGSDLL